MSASSPLPDAELAAQARVIKIAVYGLFIAAMTVAVAVVVTGNSQRLVAPITIAGLQPVALWLLRQGRHRAAATIPVLAIVVATAPLVIVSRGIGDPANVALLTAILLAGILLSPRAPFILAGVTITVTLVAYALERNGTVEPAGASLEVTLALRIAFAVVVTALIAAYFTAQRRSRTVIEETRDFYESLLAASPVMAIVVDAASGKRTYASPEFSRLTGMTLAEFNALPAEERPRFVHPDDLHIELARRSQLATGIAGAATPPMRFRTLEGWRWYTTETTVIETNTDGSPKTILLTNTDITAIVEAEADSDATRAFYEAVLSATPSMVLVLDFATAEHAYISPEFTRLTGFDIDSYNALSREERWELIHPDDRDRARRGYATSTSDPSNSGDAYRFKTIDGWRWFLTDTTVMSRDDDGTPLQVMLTSIDVTRQREEDALADAMIELNPVAQMVFDVETNVVEYMNPAYEALTGHTAAELNTLTTEGTPARELLTPSEDLVGVQAAMNRSLATGEVTSARRRLRRRDGSYAWLDCRYRPFPDPLRPSGTRMIMSAAEISEQVEAEQLHETLLYTAPMIVSVIDVASETRLYVSPEFTRATGLTLDEYAAMTPAEREERVHPDDRDELAMTGATFFATGGAEGQEARYRHWTTEGWRWLTTRATVLARDADGEIERVMITGLDITELEAAQHLSEAILEVSPAMYVLYDPSTMVVEYANPSFTETTGYTAEVLTQQLSGADAILTHPDDVETVNAAIDAAQTSGAAASVTARWICADGSERHVQLTVVPFADDATAGSTRVLATAADISDRVKAAEFASGVLGTIPAAAAVIDDASQTWLYVNSAFTAATGYTADDLADAGATDVRDRTPVEDQRRIREAIETTLRTGEVTTARRRFQVASGELRWFDTNFMRFPDPTGKWGSRYIASAIDITDKLEADHFATTVLETIPSPTLVVDNDTQTWLYANPAFTTATGYTVDDLNALGPQGGRSFTQPDEIGPVMAAVAETLETGRVTSVLRRMTSANGDVRWYNTKFLRFPDPTGRWKARYITSGTDVTEQVETESFSTALLEKVPAITVVSDYETGEVLFVNSAYTEMAGFTLEDMRNMTAEELVALTVDDDQEARAEAIERALETGEPQGFVRRARDKTGRIRWYDTRWLRFPDPTGQHRQRYLTYAMDVTDLVEAETFRKTLLESSPALTVVVDAENGQTLYTSPSFEQATGHSAESLNAMEPDDLFGLTPDEERRMVDEAIERTIETGEVTAAERTYRSADGEVRWYDSRFLHIPGFAGRQVMITGTDTTERRAAEEALRGEQARLAAANSDLESFVYIASHDLQEPLRTLVGFTDLLNDEIGSDLDEEARMALRYVNEGAARMKSLVTGLQEYSRIGMQRTVEAVDLAELVEDVVSDLGDQINRSEAVVEIDDLPIVRGDRPELRIVFQNLIGNAVKFADPTRSPRVVIAGEATDDGGWRFEVTDNGIGIAPEHGQRVFEIFRRLHARESYEGTGIGLAHCKRAVENHGGTIGVESEVGSGSTFWFTLSAEGQR